MRRRSCSMGCSPLEPPRVIVESEALHDERHVHPLQLDVISRAVTLRSNAGENVLSPFAGVGSEVFGAVRRYLGVVLDICHQSVQFEDIADDIKQLSEAGIPIYKLQEAAALMVENVTPEIVNELKKYTGTIYLSQTNQLLSGNLTRFLNLEDA